MQQKRKNECPSKNPCCKCDARIKEYVGENGGRVTKVRLSLMQVICSYEGHFRAEDLQSSLVAIGETISLPTIYRNLPMLLDSGIIRRTSIFEESANQAATYEHVFGRPHHDHLLCSECGKRVEFNYQAIEILQEAVAKEHGFELTFHNLELVGICSECALEKKRNDEQVA